MTYNAFFSFIVNLSIQNMPFLLTLNEIFLLKHINYISYLTYKVLLF